MRLPSILVAVPLLLASISCDAQQSPSASERRGITSFALYYYHFQGDLRRQPPGLNVRAKDGSSLLVHTPAEGIGPWFSCTRTAWHKSQFEAMAKAGVDAALVAYCPDHRSRAWSLPGLAAAVQALKELRDLGREYPLVALYLDFQYWSGDAKLDLGSSAGRSALYGFLRDFYQRVPEDLWLRTSTPNGSLTDAYCVVVLGESVPFEGKADGLGAELNRRFREEFGCPLLVAGTPDWRERGADFDAYVGLDPKQGLVQNDAGHIKTAVVCPGYGEVGAGGAGTSVLLREGGRSMIASWNALSKAPPDWVVINSWNGYHNGTEVTASRQYGDREQNLVMAALAALTRRGELGARLIGLEVPSNMQVRSVARVLVRVQNAGTKTWIKGGGFLRYRWLRTDGQDAGGSGRLALARDIPPRRTETLALGVATTHDGAAPLEEGKYQLALDLVPLPNAPPIPLVTVPVEVVNSLSDRATLLKSSVPSIMRSGATYSGTVTIRNDSAEVWAKGLWYVAYRWLKNGTPVDEAADTPKTPVLVQVEPGGAADVLVDVAAVDAGGRPIPAWTSDSDATYALRWEVITPSGKRLTAGSEVVHVVASDAGAHFPYAIGAGSTLDADTLYTVKTVIRNIGPDTWRSGEVRLGYHWYYWDGIELVWQGSTSPVDLPMGELKPGQEVLARMLVRTPPYAGLFVLAADVFRNGAWASAGELSRGSDLGLAYVFVRKGSFLPAHLHDEFDLDGISSDDARTDGDFDGSGHCFPAELLPPEVPTTPARSSLYPCGYLGSATGVGLDCSRSVVFEYPEKRDGAPNFITCRGQKLALSIPRCRKLHILAAAVKDTDADFVLHFSDGTTLQQRVTMTAWDKEPRYGGHVAFRTPHRHAGSAGDEPVPCYLVHYELTSDPKNTLDAVTLPDNPNVRIMAITAESW
ncbi:MAG: hypothetical protein ACUVTZ_09100 [Armatimonadota bacterium]